MLAPALGFSPASEVEEAFNFVIEDICHVLDEVTADNFILEKIDKLILYCQTTHTREKKLEETRLTSVFP